MIFFDEDDDEFEDEFYPCMTCGGEGFVMSVAEETNRDCPNCGGSGSREDQTYW